MGGEIKSMVKSVQCHELFRGIALKNHAFFISFVVVVVVPCLPKLLYP